MRTRERRDTTLAVGLVDGIAFTHHLLCGATFAFAAFPCRSLSVLSVVGLLEELICGFISAGR